MSKIFFAAFLALALLRGGSHGPGDDQVALFSTINIEEGHSAADVVCAFCTVNIRGDVHGDVAVLFGTVSVDPDRTISGDMAILFSTLHLRDNDRVNGDLATILSSADIASSASVGGDRGVVSGGLGLAVLAGPLLILAGIIGLVIFFVRRNRYPYPV
ncbi:MAG: hypothetical protein NVSMB3_12510 [Acidobacteriaceae bacterium]